MIYKGALAKTCCPLREELENVDDIDRLPVDECEGKIPDERTQGWWMKNLGKTSTIDPNIIDMYRLSEDPEAHEEKAEAEEEEDLYGSFEQVGREFVTGIRRIISLRFHIPSLSLEIILHRILSVQCNGN